jgi:putative ABC transport system ATP-binding protein
LIPYLNCLDNVVVPAVLDGVSRRTALGRARELLERLGLSKRLSHHPSELSVGERQRVALCRSLINEPEVILADEPTGNLDSVMTDEAMQILRDLNAGGQTIVMATHDLNLAEKGTRLIALREGLVEDDRPSRNGHGRAGGAKSDEVRGECVQVGEDHSGGRQE